MWKWLHKKWKLIRCKNNWAYVWHISSFYAVWKEVPKLILDLKKHFYILTEQSTRTDYVTVHVHCAPSG